MKIRRRKQKKIREHDDYPTAILSDIKELNQKYIQLFIDLHTHYSIVDADFYIAAQTALTEQYESELALLRAQAQHKTNEKFYLAESKTQKLNIFSYRRRFKWRDSIMKQVLDERVDDEIRGYISEIMEGLKPEEDEEAPAAPDETPDTAEKKPEQEAGQELAENSDMQDVIEPDNAAENEVDESDGGIDLDELEEADEGSEETDVQNAADEQSAEKPEVVNEDPEIEGEEPQTENEEAEIENEDELEAQNKIKYFKFMDDQGNEMYCSVNPFTDGVSVERLKEVLYAETIEEVSKEEYDAQGDDDSAPTESDTENEDEPEDNDETDTGGTE